MITAVFSISKSRGAYSVYERSFNNERHLDNYIALLYRKGVKLIGYEIINNPKP
jgi:hypothetical protein